MSKNIERDEVTGVDTTGHEWDGLKELNNPAPRWWLWVFFITVIWSIGYWFVYPAWPTLTGEGFRGGTVGTAQQTQYEELKAAQQEILSRKANYLEAFRQASMEEVTQDPELYAFALAGGKSAFKDNCATCHGTGGAGGPGYPNLNDDDWLWGGTLQSIHQTLLYGIRAEHPDTRATYMPAYGDMLSNKELSAVAEYVLALGPEQGRELDRALIDQGGEIYFEQCAACHRPKGQGDPEVGAPALADAIWLKSEGSKEAIIAQLREPKHGVMPFWEGRLSDDTIRQLALYVHSLGGGEVSAPEDALGKDSQQMDLPDALLQESPLDESERAPRTTAD